MEDAGSGFGTDTARAKSGSGRGLEIARRIALAAGGEVGLGQSDLGGARVDVELGLPKPERHNRARRAK